MKKIYFILIFIFNIVLAETDVKNQIFTDKTIFYNSIISNNEKNEYIDKSLKAAPCPDIVLNTWISWDEGLKVSSATYKKYNLSVNDLKILKENFSLLPDSYKKLVKEKILGIYFIENFNGAGATDWVIDNQTNVYCYLILNPVILQTPLNEWLSMRDTESFKIKKNYKIDISVDNNSKAIIYGLLHELTHAFDYVYNITPFLDPEQELFFGNHNLLDFKFISGIWLSRKETSDDELLNIGTKFNVYGTFDKKPIKDKNILKYYSQLQNKSLISLYSCTTWAEDIAEYVTFYHLTEKLKKEYKIQITLNNEILFKLEPLKLDASQSRIPIIEEIIYN